jgi:hypothetical protein
MWDLMIILTIVMFVVVGYSWIKSRTAPVVSVRALVLRKRVSSPTVQFVTFGMPGGERELVVPEAAYAVHEEGQWGRLTYQGEIFREFIPEPAVIQQPTGPPRSAPKPLDPDYHDR